MGLHERAWAGLGLMVYGKIPMVPMQIEQAIASASPANEIRIDSYEDYNDALDFSKNKKNIGFLFLLENCGELPAHDVFTQLSKPYETKGWPCFGVLIHNGVETIQGFRTLRDCPNIVGYYPIEAFRDKTKTANTLSEIWNDFTAAFENYVIPPALQETLVSIALQKTSQDSLRFMDRVATALSSNINLSWIETVALRWAPITSVVRSLDSAALTPHITLTQICELTDYPEKNHDLSAILTSKATACARIVATTILLNEKRLTGNLHSTLQLLGTQNKPGAPALLRHLVIMRDNILQIAAQELEAVDEKASG